MTSGEFADATIVFDLDGTLVDTAPDLVRALNAAGCETSYVSIDTDKGHDAFFVEEPEFEAAMTGFIDAAADARGLKKRGA